MYNSFVSDIYQTLSELNITYEKHEHPAVFTVEDSKQYDRAFEAGKTKNLFLRNKKGDKHFLVIVESSKRIDLKELSVSLKESKLSFASPERLIQYLGLTPGSVSPFGLINDQNKVVNVILDQGLLRYQKLAFHPNINTATLVISTEDFKRFLTHTGNHISFLELWAEL